MADVNWRTIRASDCELSVKASVALLTDFGPEVTLGEIASKTDIELVRSSNIGRKTLKEIREMIDFFAAEYPDPPAQPPVFIPHANIDWGLLARAVAFYQSQGYKYVEMPWAVSPESVAITCPDPAFTGAVEGLGSLVGSAEQAFLHMDLAGKLGKGRFVALTPCFRLGDYDDDLHHPYFMKVELYVNDAQDVGAKVSGDTQASGDCGPFLAYLHMLSIVGQFNRAVLGEDEIEGVHGVETSEGCDVELNGIEIGSYGIREHNGHVWVYGTGVAEPRFSQARAAR